jgi:acyl-CoA oxidase
MHEEIVDILSNDPIFSKAKRDFMSRGDRYKRALAMTNRLGELKEIHRWSNSESSIALHLLDEQVPMMLHATGQDPTLLQH